MTVDCAGSNGVHSVVGRSLHEVSGFARKDVWGTDVSRRCVKMEMFVGGLGLALVGGWMRVLPVPIVFWRALKLWQR
jgi:hypothetical protein